MTKIFFSRSEIALNALIMCKLKGSVSSVLSLYYLYNDWDSVFDFHFKSGRGFGVATETSHINKLCFTRGAN